MLTVYPEIAREISAEAARIASLRALERARKLIAESESIPVRRVA
jgi:hypothetical protein